MPKSLEKVSFLSLKFSNFFVYARILFFCFVSCVSSCYYVWPEVRAGFLDSPK